MREVLKIENVGFSYHSPVGQTQAVKGLSMTVSEGEFVAVIGPSGCGKTTVLSLIAGLISPSCGSVTVCGRTAACPSPGLGYMLQRDELFPWRTVERNVLLPLEIKGRKSQENRRYALELIKKYGLQDFKGRYPGELSGGMRQRAALIRTLSFKPELLLLDEPFSALDYQTRLNVCNDVCTIIRTEGKTAVLVTHDLSEALSVADRVTVLTRRPASVKSNHTLGFPAHLTPLERREHPDFARWFELLWRELNDD